MTEETSPWKIRYTEKAKNDLKGIIGYIKNILLEPITAQNLYNDIVIAVNSLQTMPFRFHLFNNEPWNRQGIRVLKVKNYLVFYKPDEKINTVWIVRIIYGGRDIANQLKETE